NADAVKDDLAPGDRLAERVRPRDIPLDERCRQATRPDGLAPVSHQETDVGLQLKSEAFGEPPTNEACPAGYQDRLGLVIYHVNPGNGVCGGRGRPRFDR